MPNGRNKRGQYTSEKVINQKITKELQALAHNVDIKIKPIVRDELENTLIHEIRASYTPATQNPERPYNHYHRLEASVYAVVVKDTVQIRFKKKKYRNGRTVEQVYNDLKFGTKDTPKKPVYWYGKHKYAGYISQEPHNFEARTREHMRIFLAEQKANLKNILKT